MIRKIFSFFFPARCLICKEEGADVCEFCFNQFIPSNKIILDNVEVLPCFEYGLEVGKILKGIKYQGRAETAKIIASFIYRYYKQELQEGDLLVPIPASFLTLVKRRYNVPNLICLYLQKKLKIKTVNLLKKVNNKSQVGLQKEQRWANAENFFTLKKFNNLQDKTVLLIDDVLTTGATIQAGVNKINELKPKKIIALTFAFKSLQN